MELKGVELCCCAVEVSEAFSAAKPFCCSGVLVHPPTGLIICTGLPFSRFITDREPLSSHPGFLRPHSFSDELQIRVSICTRPYLERPVTRSRGETTRHGKFSAELLMLVNCVEFKQAFLTVFQEADQWRFHGNDEDEELMRDAQFLSWFAVLKAGVLLDTSVGSETIPWQSSSSLQKGHSVVACGSPFGSHSLDLFINTLSRGIISNLAGEDNAVILTDARCLPGTEGGGLFVMKGTESVSLIGLIVSPFGWKANEWIGLTLVCSVHLIFRNVMSCTSVTDLLCDVCLPQREADLHMSITANASKAVEFPTVCFVDSGQLWGSGVFVTTKLVVTCRHVANGKSAVTLKFHHRDR